MTNPSSSVAGTGSGATATAAAAIVSKVASVTEGST